MTIPKLTAIPLDDYTIIVASREPNHNELCKSLRYDNLMPFGSFENSYANECLPVMGQSKPIHEGITLFDVPGEYTEEQIIIAAQQYALSKVEKKDIVNCLNAKKSSWIDGFQAHAKTHPFTEEDVKLMIGYALFMKEKIIKFPLKHSFKSNEEIIQETLKTALSLCNAKYNVEIEWETNHASGLKLTGHPLMDLAIKTTPKLNEQGKLIITRWERI